MKSGSFDGGVQAKERKIPFEEQVVGTAWLRAPLSTYECQQEFYLYF